MAAPTTFATEYVFGTGRIYAVNNGTGKVPTSPATIQPAQFLSLQEATVEEAVTLKELPSSYEFPDSVANGERKMTGKITFGRVDLLLLNEIVWGENSFAAGGTLVQGSEAGAVGAATPYTYSATNAATFIADLGVYYVATGKQLTSLGATGTPTTGEYTVAAGVYTFAAADGGLAILVNYTYTSLTAGSSVTVNTQIMGMAARPSFGLYLSMPSDGANSDLIIFNARAAKLNRPFKYNDYLKVELDWEAYPGANGAVYQWCSAV